MTWYNENDPKAAAWLRELARRGLIPAGDVDERSIEDINAADCGTIAHFFAGIGGWPYALRLAGWPDDRPIWTGSCPCQPFSNAGKRAGTNDPRHLWPAWFRLVRECRPATIFGEQVASAIGHGWLDGIFADLEAESYACGATILGAHGVGAPHIRQRLFWVAHRKGTGFVRAESAVDDRQDGARRDQSTGDTFEGSEDGWLGDSDPTRPQGRLIGWNSTSERAAGAASVGFWSSFDPIHCADGKSRRIEPGTFPLAHGVPARVGRLRGYGNAIVPQVAAAFVRAFMVAQKSRDEVLEGE